MAARHHLLEDYADQHEWAAAVMELLTADHQVQATEVHMKKEAGLPCAKGCTGGCRHCEFWRAVRYWRNLETGGKATEGYVGSQVSLAQLKGNIGSQVN